MSRLIGTTREHAQFWRITVDQLNSVLGKGGMVVLCHTPCQCHLLGAPSPETQNLLQTGREHPSSAKVDVGLRVICGRD